MNTDDAPLTYRVLIVDDNQAIHEDLRKILSPDAATDLVADEELLFGKASVEGARFEIDSAYQGQEGLAKLDVAAAEGRPYSLAFVDVRMPPGWDGVQTILHFWKTYPDLQIVICTAYSDYSWNDMVRQVGYSDNLVILKKPFDNIEVIQLAHALTRKWTVSREALAKHQDLERMVKQATEELAYQANHDTLTDLPNRRLFADRLEQAISFAHRRVEKLGLLYLDLDAFKVVNDTLGHGVGDLLLREVVKRAKESLRQSDTLARMGGDEFTIIASGVTDPEAAYALAQRVIDGFERPFEIEGSKLYVAASVGISIYPDHGRDVSELLRNADAAMYEAKRQGKNRAVIYNESIGLAANERLALETDLRSALAEGRLFLHYQPEFDLATRRLVRFEALLRWQHPTRGVIPPVKFIPIAEESGLIVPIGTWVMQEACRTAKNWYEAGRRDVPVAVNVAAQQFCQPDFVKTVLDIIDSVPLDRALLELELTETAIVGDLDLLAPKIAQLREHGIHVAIDDFGSGYSSFSYLERLPVAAVKIDRSFIQSLESAPKARSVVEGMVKLAHSIGLRVVVEGVETNEQLDLLIESNADEVQGFLLGVPALAHVHVPELAFSCEAGSTVLVERELLV